MIGGGATVGRNRPYGVLGAHTTKLRKFTEDDANFMQAIANILGQAVERIAGDQELRRSEDYFRSLIQARSDAILVLRPDGTITFSSDAARQFGRAQVDYIGTTGLSSASRSLRLPCALRSRTLVLVFHSRPSQPFRTFHPGRLVRNQKIRWHRSGAGDRRQSSQQYGRYNRGGQCTRSRLYFPFHREPETGRGGHGPAP